MTVRLHMKLGLVAESQRPPDSPDTVLVVEPSIGSTIRTKGNLYLVVTGEGGGELRSATNMVAERVRHEYYYDESAGISVCLKKAIKAANRELRVTERLVPKAGEAGPIGIALAVVRGNELYVATVGPAEAYLVREARLLTLPEPDPASGLPSEDGADPEVWHGDLLCGDSIILISPNATRRIGLAPIQDAVIQLHPQVAIDQIHRQLAGGGLGVAGGDGMIALEADEVAVTQKNQPLKPVWPSDSLAGVPEHSPIPMADSVVESVSTVQHTAKQVQRTADGMLRHSVYGLFDRMPRRPVQRVRGTPIAVQRERQRRVASAVVGLLLVLTVIVASLWYLAGTRGEASVTKMVQAQTAFNQAQSDWFAVAGQHRNLLLSDPATAKTYLEDAYRNLQIAAANGYAGRSDLADLTNNVVGDLNIYYHVTVIVPEVVLSFGNDDLTAAVLGPDGAAYVIDKTDSSVYRVDLVNREQTQILIKGLQPQGGGTVGTPSLLTTGGLQDVLMLDTSNNLWRWRPAAAGIPGQGTPLEVNDSDSGTWGADVRAIGTFETDVNLGQYSLYVVVPSAGQVLKYLEASDGSGYYPQDRAAYLTSPSLAQVDDMYIDGSVYLADDGVILRYDSGTQIRGWTADLPGDTVLRPAAPFYTQISADNVLADQGNLYAYDGVGRRVVEITKLNGKYVQEFVLPPNSPYFSAIQGMFVRTGPNGTNPTLFWVESGNLMSAPLGTPTLASPSPSVKASLLPSLKPSSGAKPTPTPKKT